MSWINESTSYKYLKNFYNNIDPDTNEQLAFKNALNWALNMLEEQGNALYNIEQAQNANVIQLPKQKPKLKLIKGGK